VNAAVLDDMLKAGQLGTSRNQFLIREGQVSNLSTGRSRSSYTQRCICLPVAVTQFLLGTFLPDGSSLPAIAAMPRRWHPGPPGHETALAVSAQAVNRGLPDAAPFREAAPEAWRMSRLEV
jgi:hypothetical protein